MAQTVKVPRKNGTITLNDFRSPERVYEVADHHVSVPDDELPDFLLRVEGAEVTAGSPSKEKP